MREVTITIQLPDDAVVVVDAPDADALEEGASDLNEHAPDEAAVSKYWTFCTDNTKRLYAAMAEVELETGEAFTFDAVAERLDMSVAEVQTYNRNAGRGARLWRDRHDGDEPPIRTVAVSVAPGGYKRKKVFRLSPAGVAKIVARLPKEGSDE